MKNKSLIIFGTGQQSDIISFYLKNYLEKLLHIALMINILKINLMA